MLLQIPGVLDKDEVARVRTIVDGGEWVDGNVTSGPQSALAKRNAQLSEASPQAREAGALILSKLEKAPLFIAGALPLKVFPPLFNRYEGGQNFGAHIDNSVRRNRAGDLRVRTDISATLFLAAPESYKGGELVIEDTYGVHSVKLPAGDLILYPASSLHRVQPVSEGARVASFFWVQSMVRDDAQRTLLFDMDMAVQRLGGELGLAHPSVVSLTGSYHNLLRMWAET